MLYILVAEDEEEILEIHEMNLSTAFPLEVCLARNGKEAIEIIQKRGRPELVISDYRMPNGDGHYLYEAVKRLQPHVPFILCTADFQEDLQAKFVGVEGIIAKPKIFKPLIDLVAKHVTRLEESPEFIPVRIPLLLRIGDIKFDLFMRLGENRFIKVLNAGESFLSSDAQRFQQKKVTYLYVSRRDAYAFLISYEENIQLLLRSEKLPMSDLISLSLESIESVERISKIFGWTPEVIQNAKAAVNLAIKTVSSEGDILKLLKNKLASPYSNYTKHIGQLSLITCAFCHHFGWTSESTQLKLAMAALMHDIAIDDSYYNSELQTIQEWNNLASDSKNKSKDVQKYRNHPIEASNILLGLKNLPPDIDQIILQHHETQDGTGFPRNLASNRISPMSTLFIIVEDLIDFIGEDENLEAKVQEFLRVRGDRYNRGNFRKVFEDLKTHMKV